MIPINSTNIRIIDIPDKLSGEKQITQFKKLFNSLHKNEEYSHLSFIKHRRFIHDVDASFQIISTDEDTLYFTISFKLNGANFKLERSKYGSGSVKFYAQKDQFEFEVKELNFIWDNMDRTLETIQEQITKFFDQYRLFQF